MSFATYTVVSASVAGGSGTGVAATLIKPGRAKVASLAISFKPAIVKELGWLDGERIAVQMGSDEHHGLIRLRKDKTGSACLKKLAAGGGKGIRGGEYYRLGLGVVAQFVDRAEPKKWVQFEAVEDGWIEIVLPAWADETGPKGRTERARLSIGAPALPPPRVPPKANLTSRMMGDPDPSRSALAQRGNGQPGLTRGEARRHAEAHEAPEYAAGEQADWNRKAKADNFLADLMQIFGLTSSEGRIVRELADGKLKSREALHLAAYGDDPNGGPEIKIIDVFMTKLRKKLQARMVTVDTIRGEGFRLSPPMVARIMVLVGTARADERSRDDDEAELAELELAESGEVA